MCIDWQTIAAIASAVAALAALWISWVAVGTQKASARPLPFIECGNYENDIYVAIKNLGVGPFVIKSLSVKDSLTGVERNNVLHQIPENGNFPWRDYVTDEIEGRPIGPQGELVLLRLHNEAGDRDRMQLRLALSYLNVHVVGTDIYGRTFEHKRDLKLFSILDE